MEIIGKVSCKIEICNVTQNYENRKANNLQFWLPLARNTEPTIQSQNGHANNSRNPFDNRMEKHINKRCNKLEENACETSRCQNTDKQNFRRFKFVTSKNFSPTMPQFNKWKTNQSSENGNYEYRATLHQRICDGVHVINKHLIPLLLILFFPLIIFAYFLFQFRDFGFMLVGMNSFIMYGALWGYTIKSSSKEKI